MELWKASDWERSHPWLSGLVNGTIVAIGFGLSYAWTSDSKSRAMLFGLVVGAAVAIVRGVMLSREKEKSSS